MKLLLIFACAIVTILGRQGFCPGEQEWGFSEVRPGAHMFWWLYYTTQPNVRPTDKPLVLWLQGGPGASSTGFGNFEELGPLDINLNPRNHTWVKDCNVMFVDNPVGTGWSYVENNSLLTTTNKQIALDLVALMRDFYRQFPEFEETAMYITSESYGGKMAAEFALELVAAIRRGEIRANFKGVGLGDAWISPIDSVLTWAPYLLGFGMVDQRGYNRLQKVARRCQKSVEEGRWEDATDDWESAEYRVWGVTHGADMYNVLARQPYFERNKKIALPGIEEREAKELELENIMNIQVREALGLPDNITWSDSNGEVFNALKGDFMKPVTNVVELLLNTTDIKVAVISGQLDLIVDTPGTVAWVERLRWPNQGRWRWSFRKGLAANGYIEGFVKRYRNFGMYWVNRAGHMVPADNPAGMDAVLRDLTDNYSGR